jgi:hypothetical protein
MAKTIPASMVVPITQALARQPVVTAANRGLEAIRAALSAAYIQCRAEVINQSSHTPIMSDPGHELYYQCPLHPADENLRKWRFGVRAEALANTTVRLRDTGGLFTVDVLVPAGAVRADGLYTSTVTFSHDAEIYDLEVVFTSGSCDIYQVLFAPERDESLFANSALVLQDGTTNYAPDDQAFLDESPLTPARHEELLQLARQIYRNTYGQAIAWSRATGSTPQSWTPANIVRVAVPPTPDGGPASLTVYAPGTLTLQSSLGSVVGVGVLPVASGFAEQAPLWADIQILGSARYLSAYWSPAYPPGATEAAAIPAMEGMTDEFGDDIVDELGSPLR